MCVRVGVCVCVCVRVCVLVLAVAVGSTVLRRCFDSLSLDASMDDADLQRALALSRLDLDAAQLSQPSESSSVAAPASASASASFAFSASASSGECPKCHLSDIPSTPGGSLFVFDCRLHHECCHACAYDYTKGRLSEWQLPLCPFGCSDNVLSAAKVQQLVGTEVRVAVWHECCAVLRCAALRCAV